MEGSSVLEELLAENEMLRLKLNSYESESKVENVTVLSASIFNVEQELPDRLLISGVLIGEGMWKNVYYPPKEIKAMTENYRDLLNSLNILVDHGNTEDFKNSAVGSLSEVKWNPDLNAALFKGVVVDRKAIKGILNGDYTSISLKSKIDKVLSNGVWTARNIVPIEASLTGTPACNVCHIFKVEELSQGSKASVTYLGISELDMTRSEDGNVSSEGTSTEATDEAIELNEFYVTVLPKEDDQEEEIDLEFMPLTEALAGKRRIYGYYPPGRYKKPSTRVKRKRYYYYYGYPYYYYGYPPYYYYYYKDQEEDSDQEDEEEEVLTVQFKVIKNTKTGKWIVMRSTSKEGFGKWRIVKQFDSEKEAREYVSNLHIDDTESGSNVESDANASVKYRIKKTEDGKYGVFQVTPTGEGVGELKLLKAFDSREDAEAYMRELMGKGSYPEADSKSGSEEGLSESKPESESGSENIEESGNVSKSGSEESSQEESTSTSEDEAGNEPSDQESVKSESPTETVTTTTTGKTRSIEELLKEITEGITPERAADLLLHLERR